MSWPAVVFVAVSDERDEQAAIALSQAATHNPPDLIFPIDPLSNQNLCVCVNREST